MFGKRGSPLQPQAISFRSALIALAGLATGLPIAWLSITKLLLFISVLVFWFTLQRRHKVCFAAPGLWTPWAVLAVIFSFAASLLWTQAGLVPALAAFNKHGKLLELLLLMSLVRSQSEARLGMLAFAVGQIFLLLSSWLLALGVPLVWATASGRGNEVVVFSSYLSQSIVFATSAAVFWHLRTQRLWPRWLGVGFAGLALLNVFALLIGRTGYLVAITLVSLTVMWALPKRSRLPVLVVLPLLLLTGLYFGSTRVQQNLSTVIQETRNYAVAGRDESATGWVNNSAGWRLNAWHRSLQAIEARPVSGYGVGSWAMIVNRFEGPTAAPTFGTAQIRNPHQEYLLWTVELGVTGTLLLVLLLVCLIRDSRKFKAPIAHSIQCVVAALALSCLFNSTLFDGLIGDYFCLLLGLLMALGLQQRTASHDRQTALRQNREPKVAA